jgi:hypothetical protein
MADIYSTCKHCGRPIFGWVLSSRITKRILTDWYHTHNNLPWCRMDADGWSSETRAVPNE